MIVFDLKCSAGHVFEAWFGSSRAYEEQRSGGLVACPLCGDAEIAKAVMAPNVAAKGNQRGEPMPAKSTETGAAPSPEAVKAALIAMARAQSELLERSQWVGTAFTDRARAMHVGDEAPAQIHGQASVEEARALVEEGVAVLPLPFPVVPPEQRN